MSNTTTGDLIALDILPELPGFWEKHPDGLTIKALARLTELPYHLAHQAWVAIERLGEGRIINRPDRSPQYLVPLDYTVPAYDLTKKQMAVLDAFAGGAGAGNVVAMSFRELCRISQVSSGSIIAMIGALERKGYVEQLSKGSGTNPNVYRIYPDGDGPRWGG